MVLLDVKFKIKDIVYLTTDVEQDKRIVSGYIVRDNSIIYYLSCGTHETMHYDFEITADIDILNKLGIE